jgi:hypothetical protein
VGRRRRRTPRKNATTTAHPPLWPYLAGVAGLLFIVMVAGTRHMQREQARWREMGEQDARRRAADSVGAVLPEAPPR